MAQFASDSFTGTAATELSAYNADWTEHGSYASGQLVISDANRLRAGVNASSLYYHSGTPASADYSVSADIFAKETDGGTHNAGVVGRVNTGANTFYNARYLGQTTDAWQLFKFVAGVATQLGSSSTQSLTDETSYNVKLEMIGSSSTAVKLYKEGSGSATISVTDSSSPITAAGKAGIRLLPNDAPSNTTGLHMDNFSADDVVSAASDPSRRAFPRAILNF